MTLASTFAKANLSQKLRVRKLPEGERGKKEKYAREMLFKVY